MAEELAEHAGGFNQQFQRQFQVLGPFLDGEGRLGEGDQVLFAKLFLFLGQRDHRLLLPARVVEALSIVNGSATCHKVRTSLECGVRHRFVFYNSTMFVDRVTIYVKGGDGGRGCCSFRREKYVPKGGPDGGDGGDGGAVIVRALAGADSLAEVAHKKHWRAQNGGRGGIANRHGRRGRDVVISVPPGTLVLDRDRGHVLRDLTEAGEEVTVGKGGRGGRGNKAFATAVNQAPREIQPGTPGEERWLVLELKVIADAGLIGLPNAGKSTLLSRLSQAQPEIADYPFTTKHPNLGKVHVGGERTFILADLPGLIEGAHSGIGLGHEFLRHVERTRVLVHLVEPLPPDGNDPLQNYRTVRRELDLHGRELVDKPEIIALSKSELTGSDEVRRRLEQELGRPVLGISAVTGQGLAQLVGAVAECLAALPVTANGEDSSFRARAVSAKR
jgi:GTP-binding protein